MQPFLLIATVSMISEKLFFPISMATIDGKTSYFLKTIQLINQNYFWTNGVKRIKNTHGK